MYIQKYSKILFYNIVVIIFLLLISEGVFRSLYPEQRFCSRTFPGQFENRKISWARSDPDLGWVFSGKNLHTFRNPYYQRNSWTFYSNSEGFRNRSDFRNIGAKNGKRRVIILGNSFVFGPYINNTDTLSHLLNEKLGNQFEVFNLGIPGWGIDQVYLAYKKYVDIIDPDFVIVVYIDHDILRVFESFRKTEGMNKPSFKINNGNLVIRNSYDRANILDFGSKYSYIINNFYCKKYKIHVSMNITKALFKALSEDVNSIGKKLAIIRYPLKIEVIRRERFTSFNLKEFFEKHDITFIDPLKAMATQGEDIKKNFYLRNDSHPAKEGNAFLANYIIEKIFSKK